MAWHDSRVNDLLYGMLHQTGVAVGAQTRQWMAALGLISGFGSVVFFSSFFFASLRGNGVGAWVRVIPKGMEHLQELVELLLLHKN